MAIDFRRVYATLLDQWLQINPHQLLYGEFQQLQLLA
jgi:hypothetical protein